MPEAEFQFTIQGDNQEEVARKLTQLLAAEFATEVRRVSAKSGGTQVTRGVDPVAVGALVLSIPAAVLAAVDVVQRLKKKKQLDTFLKKAGQITQKTTTVKIRITTPKGEQFELERAETAQLLDSAVTKK